MMQVLINLLSNAIKFSEDGAEVRCSVATIELIRKVDLTIKVTDCGVGISRQEIPKLFTRFFQT